MNDGSKNGCLHVLNIRDGIWHKLPNILLSASRNIYKIVDTAENNEANNTSVVRTLFCLKLFCLPDWSRLPGQQHSLGTVQCVHWGFYKHQSQKTHNSETFHFCVKSTDKLRHH